MEVLLAFLLDALERGEGVTLCTVLDAAGSVPRGAGAQMAVASSGTACGTVGGGALELQTTALARMALTDGRARIERFSLADEVGTLGMLCGGEATVLVWPLAPQDTVFLHRVQNALSSRERLSLCLVLHDGRVEPSLVPQESLTPRWDGARYTQPLCRAERACIVGAGHVAQALAPLLARIGFAVTVYDERPALVCRAVFPTAEALLCGAFTDAARLHITAEDYAVVMTPGHQADFAVLSQVLRTEATYVGCIGSHKKAAALAERLREQGFDEADVARIHSPIGLPILAETPEEIAVSIAAELIEHRAKHRRGET